MQGLLEPWQNPSPAQILDQAGWARSVGGTNPYLTLFARGGISRAQADQAVEAKLIHELPSARGCTYVLPATDYQLALSLAGHVYAKGNETRVVRELGIQPDELERLEQAVLDALKDGPLDVNGIKAAAGDKIRNLGAEGKKRGVTTTLALALQPLQLAGRIRRIPSNGRFDTQTYRYALWHDSPMADGAIPPEDAAIELARKFFRWTGPATAAHFKWFSGLGVKAVKEAMEGAGVVPVPDLPDHWIRPEDLDEWLTWSPPCEPCYRLVSSIDSVLLLRRDIRSLVAESDLMIPSFDEKGVKVEVGGLQDLSSNAILDRGRLIGLWEYDPESQEIVWHSWVTDDSALDEEVKRTEAFVRDDLGDCRSFSLDSPESRKPRLAALRQAATAR